MFVSPVLSYEKAFNQQPVQARGHRDRLHPAGQLGVRPHPHQGAGTSVLVQVTTAHFS